MKDKPADSERSNQSGSQKEPAASKTSKLADQALEQYSAGKLAESI